MKFLKNIWLFIKYQLAKKPDPFNEIKHPSQRKIKEIIRKHSWVVLVFLLMGCSFKPSSSELINGGFKKKNLVYKGEEFVMYELSTNSWDLQYYVKDNLWVIEAGGYATPHKMTKKKFNVAIEKSKINN